VSKLVRGLLWSSPGELLLLLSGNGGREPFGKPDDEERPPLEAVTRRLVKTQQAEKT
jgi:hypothetical protein